MKKIKEILLVFVLFVGVLNVKALTSDNITYENEGVTESLTSAIDKLYSELKEYKTNGSVTSTEMLEGYTGYAKGKLVSGSIKKKGSTTYTPGVNNQIINRGQYLDEDQTILGDGDLVAENIKSGVELFGVNGTYTSDANATASQILSGKTAYVNGNKITGNHSSQNHTYSLVIRKFDEHNNSSSSISGTYTVAQTGKIIVTATCQSSGQSCEKALNFTIDKTPISYQSTGWTGWDQMFYYTGNVNKGQIINYSMTSTSSTNANSSVFLYVYLVY